MIKEAEKFDGVTGYGGFAGVGCRGDILKPSVFVFLKVDGLGASKLSVVSQRVGLPRKINRTVIIAVPDGGLLHDYILHGLKPKISDMANMTLCADGDVGPRFPDKKSDTKDTSTTARRAILDSETPAQSVKYFTVLSSGNPFRTNSWKFFSVKKLTDRVFWFMRRSARLDIEVPESSRPRRMPVLFVRRVLGMDGGACCI